MAALGRRAKLLDIKRMAKARATMAKLGPVSKVFPVLWIAFLLCWVGTELSFGWTQDRVLVWIGLLAAFLVMEAIGVIRDASRDTMSETLWWFQGQGWARGILTSILGLAISLRFFSLRYFFVEDAMPSWMEWGPLALLSCGLAGWLAVHFFAKGKHG